MTETTKLHLKIFKLLENHEQQKKTLLELAHSMFQEKTKEITWVQTDITELERSIKFAKLHKNKTFIFQTYLNERIELVTSYAEYLLEYLKTRFK